MQRGGRDRPVTSRAESSWWDPQCWDFTVRRWREPWYRTFNIVSEEKAEPRYLKTNRQTHKIKTTGHFSWIVPFQLLFPLLGERKMHVKGKETNLEEIIIQGTECISYNCFTLTGLNENECNKTKAQRRGNRITEWKGDFKLQESNWGPMERHNRTDN